VPYDPAIAALRNIWARHHSDRGGNLINPDQDPNVFTGTKRGVQQLDTFGPQPSIDDFMMQVDPDLNNLSGVPSPDTAHRIAFETLLKMKLNPFDPHGGL